MTLLLLVKVTLFVSIAFAAGGVAAAAWAEGKGKY
jgi:hypothetical protein